MSVAIALDIARRYGQEDGAHHKMWVIDQMVRALTDCPIVTVAAIHRGQPYTFTSMGKSETYKQFVANACSGEDGPDTYEWDTGIAP